MSGSTTARTVMPIQTIRPWPRPYRQVRKPRSRVLKPQKQCGGGGWRVLRTERGLAELLHQPSRRGTNECCASGNACVGAIVRHQQWDFLDARVDAVFREQSPHFIKEWIKHRRNSAAHDHHVWLEQIDDVS